MKGTQLLVVRQCKKPTLRSSTFGFFRHAKPTLKNQKSLLFLTAPEQNIFAKQKQSRKKTVK